MLREYLQEWIKKIVQEGFVMNRYLSYNSSRSMQDRSLLKFTGQHDPVMCLYYTRAVCVAKDQHRKWIQVGQEPHFVKDVGLLQPPHARFFLIALPARHLP